MPEPVFGVDSNDFSWFVRPNRSLTHQGRCLWLYLIGINAFLIATVAFLVGAWPVVPFAGLEVILVGAAFWCIGQHDEDFERIEVRAGTFIWSCRDGKQVSHLQGNAVWAQFVLKRIRGQKFLFLRYAGQEVSIGRGVTEGQRIMLAQIVKARVCD
jgi:uncharacterized membrane protein